jgi:GAF domain-containing protein
MFDWIRNFLEPNLADPDDARQQYLLHLVILALSVPGLLFGLVSGFLWVTGKGPVTGFVAGIGVQFFYLLAYWISRRGYVKLASNLPVLAVFLAMFGGGLQVGLGHSTYIGFAMTTLTASILIGPIAGVVYAILSAGAYWFTGVYQAGGNIASVYTPQATLSADIAGLFFGLIVLVAFTYIYSRQIQRAVHRAEILSNDLRAQQQNLETEVQRRTESLARRVSQIRTAAEISNAINKLQEQDDLLQEVVDLIKERFDLYYAGVFLIDDSSRFAVLEAGTGEAGAAMIEERHALPIGGNSMIGWTVANKRPRIALDTELDAVRFVNPHLPLTRSELALPMIANDRVVGALTVQSEQVNAFDEDDIVALQGIADTLTIALENARLFQETQTSLDEIRAVQRQYITNAWSDKMSTDGDIQYTSGSQAHAQPEEENALDVPLTLRDEIIGQITVESDDEWSSEEKEWVEAVATQAALALENARLLEESQQLALRERLIAEITGKIWSSTTVDSILQTAVKELGNALSVSEATIELSLEKSND